MGKVYRLQYLLALVLVVLVGCASETERDTERSAGLHVVATFFPVADIVRQVGGEHITVQMLLPPEGDLHTFSPTARQMKLLQRADVVFTLGLGAEPFLEKMFRGLGRKRLRVIELGRGCWTLPADAEHHHEHEGEQHHHDEAVDPHVWLSIENAIRMTRNAQKALAQIDPVHSADYQRNADRLVAELKRLRDDLKARAGSWQKRKFIAAHGAYRYLAEEAGLEQVAVFEPLPGVEPSARWIRDLIRTARREGVRVIFTAPPASPRLVEVIATDLQVPVFLLDTLERPTAEPGGDYQSRMQRNIETLDQAMR
ncbi:MAG: zinc ABC transporter substrate-binding protein [Chthonomonadetes bacterium]|nr:zinc ABC transporter substrate-binding protein [Chthonomonadetes bacterium]